MNRPFHFRRGFTLTELLISIGLALLVMYGINRVFKATADTIGTGQALSDANRLLRAAQTTFTQDIEPRTQTVTPPTSHLSGILPHFQQPGIIIRNEAVTGYLNKADYDAAVTASFRVDTLSFFSGKAGVNTAQLFDRMTGQTSGSKEQIVSEQEIAASVAWIHYGHLALPDETEIALVVAAGPTNFGNYKYPGTLTPTTNRHNFYAPDWILGRNAIVLKKRDATLLAPGSRGYLYDKDGFHQAFFSGGAAGSTTIPLAYNTGAVITQDGVTDPAVRASSTVNQALIQWSLYDIAGNDPAFLDGLGAPVDGTESAPLPQADSGVPAFTGLYAKILAAPTTWWAQMGTSAPPAAGTPSEAYRFFANPFNVKPFTGTPGGMSLVEKAAMTTPVFVPGCTQFIVEFAGDFDAAPGLDVTAGNAIQWYGLPRDVNEDGDTTDPEDVIAIAADRDAAATVHLAAWGPTELTPFTATTGKPMLIRITMTVVDKATRLPDGITREFTFRIPR